MLKPRFVFDRYLTTAGWMCLAIAGLAFAVALLGVVINPFIGNWIQSTGLAFVGLLYLLFVLGSFAPGGTRFLGASEIFAQRQDNDPDAPTPAQPLRSSATRDSVPHENL